MYANAITPSKLIALIFLIFSTAGAILWLACLVDTAMPAFDSTGVALLVTTLGSLILSILFFRRVAWVRIVTSILLHILILALLASLLYTLSTTEDTTEKAIVISFTGLGAGLLFTAILGLHSEGMKRDMAGGGSPASQVRTPKLIYLFCAIGCLLLFLAFAAWWILPLLLAKPTVTTDYLSQANQANKPADYDPNQNAAPHYEKLFSEFVPLPEALKEIWRSWPAELEPNEYKSLEDWAPLNEPVLPALTQAARCPYWWFEMKSSTGALSGIEVPHTDHVRECAWAGVLLAKFKAHQGDIDGAMRLLLDVHMMGVHRAEGGTLLEQLTGLAVCKLVYDALFAILERCEVAKGTLERALDALTPQMSRINVPRFSEVERLYGLDSIQRSFTDDGKGDGRLIPERLYTTKKNRARLFTFPISYLDAVKICVTHPGRWETACLSEAYFAFVPDLARQTPWELHTQNSSYEERLKEVLEGNYYLHDGLAAVGQCIRTGWRSRVTGDATLTVLAVFLYRAQEGRLPESLKQLVDAHLLQRYPMDPYSGAPLAYRVTGNAFALFSVGEDFVDNDGLPCDWADETGGDQVFWPIPKPDEIRNILKAVDDE